MEQVAFSPPLKHSNSYKKNIYSILEKSNNYFLLVKEFIFVPTEIASVIAKVRGAESVRNEPTSPSETLKTLEEFAYKGLFSASVIPTILHPRPFAKLAKSMVSLV